MYRDNWLPRGEAFLLAAQDVQINRPFVGGHITRRYAGEKTPVVQVNLNRALYLAEPYFDRSTLSVSGPR